jgi:hypothetical protein
MPGIYGTMLVRIALNENNTEDLDIIHQYQNESKLVTTAREVQRDPEQSLPTLTDLVPRVSLLDINTPGKQLDLAARILPYNPPQVLTEQRRVPQILSIAGLAGGNYTKPINVNLTDAAIIANNSIATDIHDPVNARELDNDWSLPVADYQGNFGTNYAAAASVALSGYQQQSVKQTLYPVFRRRGSANSFTLPNDSALLVTFSAKPRVKSADFGFWSLTVYGDDQYLVPNMLNRSEVGDRTYDLKYEDSTPVYGPDADDSTDGPFSILIQPASIRPPDNWTSNWLPVSENFSWICMYLFLHFDLQSILTDVSTLVRPGGFYGQWKLRLSYGPEY